MGSVLLDRLNGRAILVVVLGRRGGDHRKGESNQIRITQVYVVSPEDFIVSKLALPDGGVQDEKDVKSVLVRIEGTIDRKYLEKRATVAGVQAIKRELERI